MRKTSPLFVILLVLLAALSVFLFVRYRSTDTALQAMQSEQQTTRARYDRALDDIATIQDSLGAIVLGDDAGTMKSTALRSERRLTPDRSDEALERVAELRAGIGRARDRIRQLEKRLRDGGVKVAGLERLTANLR